jgi:hypothetical protein
MIAVNCTTEHLRHALDSINVRYLGNITLVDLEQTGKQIQFSLGVKDSKSPGVLLDSKRRRTASACWHTLGHFIDELFEVTKEAEVYSDWTGDWITKAGRRKPAGQEYRHQKPYPDALPCLRLQQQGAESD